MYNLKIVHMIDSEIARRTAQLNLTRMNLDDAWTSYETGELELKDIIDDADRLQEEMSRQQAAIDVCLFFKKKILREDLS